MYIEGRIPEYPEKTPGDELLKAIIRKDVANVPPSMVRTIVCSAVGSVFRWTLRRLLREKVRYTWAILS